jgi:hypothetical protein
MSTSTLDLRSGIFECDCSPDIAAIGRRHARRNAQMTDPITQNRSQLLAAKRWMDDEAGMERASLSPAEYVAYRMKILPADAQALVDAVYALDGEPE